MITNSVPNLYQKAKCYPTYSACEPIPHASPLRLTLVVITERAVERTTTAVYFSLYRKKLAAARLRPGTVCTATLCDDRLWMDHPTSPEPFLGLTFVFVQLVKSRKDLSWERSIPLVFSLARSRSRILAVTERASMPLQ